MNLALTPELERLIDEEVQSGSYESPGEVVRDALRLLKERREMRLQRLGALRREVDKGIAQLENGEFTEYAAEDSTKLAERIKSEGLARLERARRRAG